MTANSNAQIKQLYEEQGLNAEQIAEALDHEIAGVRLVLAECSSDYRKAQGKEPLVPFDEVVEAKKAITQIMRYTDDDNLRFRSARFLLNEGLGRNEVRGAVKNLNINVTLINEQLRRARASIAQGRAKIIDIPSDIKTLVESTA